MQAGFHQVMAALENLEAAFSQNADACQLSELRYLHDRLTTLVIECEEALARADARIFPPATFEHVVVSGTNGVGAD